MGLASATQTALSGVHAASTSIGVIADNLANARTPACKQSRPVYGTQTPQTFGLGSAPTGSSGGTNPMQGDEVS